MEASENRESDRLAKLHQLRFRERSLTRKWETALERLGHFPNGALEREVERLTVERDSLRQAILTLSSDQADGLKAG